MWQANDLIVVSDLHLAKKKEGIGENGQDLFQADESLAQFLDWILKDTKDTLVVLNGDILDYLAISPNPEAKTAIVELTQLPERTNAIIKDHPAIFDALARIANSSRHQIFITGGNHDPELIFPSVQQVIEKRLTGSANARSLRWLVQGEAFALQVGPVKTLIEHGDVLDAWNRVNRSALRSAVSLASRGLLPCHRYELPPGSKLVLDCLLTLKLDYPWVELLKPETSTVPHLLRYYLPKSRLPEFKDALFHCVQAAKNHVVVELCEALDPQQLFMATTGVPAEGADSALDYFRNLLNQLNRQATTFRKNSLISRLRKATLRDTFFDISKAETGTYKVLSFLVKNGADLLIHGHTHSAKAYKVVAKTDNGEREGLYLNSGTWARLLRLPMHDDDDNIWRQFVDDLRYGKAEGFARGFERLTFVRVKFDGKRTVTRLQEWKAGAPIDLAVHSFVPEHAAWAQES